MEDRESRESAITEQLRKTLDYACNILTGDTMWWRYAKVPGCNYCLTTFGEAITLDADYKTKFSPRTLFAFNDGVVNFTA